MEFMNKSIFDHLNMSLDESCSSYNRYHCSFHEFEKTCFALKSENSYIWLIDLFIRDELATNNGLVMEYVFLELEKRRKFSLSFLINPSQTVSSISHIWRNARVLEQEATDLFGVKFTRKYFPTYKFSEGNYPLRKNFQGQVVGINNLSSDQSFNLELLSENLLKRNLCKLDIKLKNNLVSECHIQKGLFHVGIEKILEASHLNQAFSLIESYFPNRSCEISFLLSTLLEDSFDEKISDRAKAIRMVLLELNRIQEHIKFLKNISEEFQLESLYMNALVWLKKVQSLMMSYSGNEYLKGSIRLGGVVKDIGQVWLSRTINELVWLEKSLNQSYRNLIQSQYVKSAFDFRLMSKGVASTWSLSGPLARAVGINLDYRKAFPFYFYEDIDFDIPIGVEGSGYDLLTVRVLEIFQSIKIIIQVLDNLPTGSILLKDRAAFLEMKQGQKELDEKTYFDSVKKLMIFPEMLNHKIIEGSHGLLSLGLECRDSKIERFHMHSDSAALVELFKKIIKGNEVHKVMPLWSILDVNLKEVEK